MVFRRYAPFEQFGGGFEGDNRSGPSTDLSATARTTGKVPFDKQGVGMITGISSGTQFVGAGSTVGKILGKHTSAVSASLASSSKIKNGVSLVAYTAGANPMVPGAPEIDTFVDFTAEWIGSSLRLSGAVRGDNFPNCEVFVVDDAGTSCLLFDGRTNGGQTTGPMTRLVGKNESQSLGGFNLVTGLSKSGNFAAPRTSCPISQM